MVKYKICKTCKKWPGCRLPINGEDHCLNWQDPAGYSQDIWEAIARKDLNSLVQFLNDARKITLDK